VAGSGASLSCFKNSLYNVIRIIIGKRETVDFSYVTVTVLWAVMYLPPQLNKEHITKYPVLIDMSVAQQ